MENGNIRTPGEVRAFQDGYERGYRECTAGNQSAWMWWMAAGVGIGTLLWFTVGWIT